VLGAEERGGTERDETADGGSGQNENGKLVPEMTAEMADREEPQGQDTAFERCRKDGADGARDDTDDDVASAHKHLDSFGEW
jgi:hypothetical protein